MLRHGHARKGAKSPTYRSWLSMWARCTDKSHRYYADYGGRGIAVCKRWEKFDHFLVDMGVRPEGKTLNRINNNKGYNKANCKWSTWVEQHCNRRDNHMVTFRGRMQPIAAWAREYGLRYSTVLMRLSRGWAPHRAFTVKINPRYLRKNKRKPR